MEREDGIIEYGLVLDTDRDRVADCQLALSSDAPGGEFRVLLKNLDTGKSDERVGGPYGYPFEFGFPDASDRRLPQGARPSLYVDFLGVWQQRCAEPDGPLPVVRVRNPHRGRACDRLGLRTRRSVAPDPPEPRCAVRRLRGQRCLGPRPLTRSGHELEPIHRRSSPGALRLRLRGQQ